MSEGSGEHRPAWIYLLLIVALTAFSVSAILIRFASDAPGPAVAVWRTIFASLLLAPFALVRSRNEWRRMTRRDWLLIMAAGVTLGLHFIAFIESIYHTTIASAAVLVSLSPIFMGLIGYFVLRERLPRAEVIAIAIAILGTVVLGIADARSGEAAVEAAQPLLGNSLALTAAFLVSIYLIIGRVVRRKQSWLAYVAPLYAVTAMTTLTAAFVMDIRLLGYDTDIYLLCLSMAVIPQIVGHGSYNSLIRYFPAATLGLAMLVEPIGASALAYVLFSESPSLLSIVAMLIILAAVGSVIRPGGPEDSGIRDVREEND